MKQEKNLICFLGSPWAEETILTIPLLRKILYMKRSVVSILGVCGLLVWLLGECSSSFISPTEGKYRSQDIPGNVTASDTLTSGLVRITWDSVANAEGYLVYRSKGSATDSFLPVSSEVSGLVYLDSTVVPETTYFYRVRTILQTGDTSLPSSSDMGMALENPSTYIPAFAASDGSFADRVVLTWEKAFSSRNPGHRFRTDSSARRGPPFAPQR